MSYDIRMVNKETGDVEHLDGEHVIRGGTYALGGTTEAWLNITYNYAPFFYRFICGEKGIRAIYGKTGREALPILADAINKLSGEPDKDYWTPTEGNAKRALEGLAVFAAALPDAVFEGD